MCGICGIYVHNQNVDVPQRVINKMADTLRHRGPDDEGFFFGDKVPGGHRVGLGHRRLSIIDVEAGHQPLSNEDGSCWIIFNGEIYNYRELTADLIEKGHVFSTRSDTEAILHLYEEYKERCVDYLNGIFAFAIWDEKKKKLFIARDRFGTKCLYYYSDDDYFIFASEVKALLTTEIVHAKLDSLALKEYFSFQNVYTNKTLFENIQSVLPGYFIEIQNHRVKETKYWEVAFHTHHDCGESYYISALREMLPAIVERQLMSDVPLGSFLSGGMDSGVLTALASRHIHPLPTFTCGFDLSSVSGLELSFDERQEAQELVQFLGTDHQEIVLHAGDMQRVLPKLVWHLEDLRVGMSYPNYFVSDLAGKKVKVALSGAGGDEIFAGYPWRYEKALQAGQEHLREEYFSYWQRLVKEEVMDSFFSRALYREMKDYSLKTVFERALSFEPEEDILNQVLAFELRTFLTGLLVVDDKLGMACSLEIRVPYLDNELVDFMLTVPSRYKYKKGVSKYLMKRAMEGILPDFVLSRKKQGFSPPDESWYRGPSMNYIREVLLSERALSRDIFNPDYLKTVIREHLEGKVNHRLLIWSLLCFEWWCRIFLEGEEV